jgi:putative glycosyl hydrolase-like family 15 (GHL15) protein
MRHRLVPGLVLMLLVLPAQAGATPVGHVRYATDSHAAFPDIGQSAQRHQFVILNAWQQDRLRALKTANPDVKVLVYKNLSFSNHMTDSGFASVGVTGAEAERDHPEWFLRNSSGERFSSWSYSWSWAMDVGSGSYQRRWADNIVAELRSQGWDGVFMDDTNPTMKYHYTASEVAKYPTDAAYSAATRSALAEIGPRVRAEGKLAIANIGSWAEYPEIASDWLQFLDGGMDEMFLKWGTRTGDGYADLGRWKTQFDALRSADHRGKVYMAITHSEPDDAAAARYGYATMLLASDGWGQFALARDYTTETWFPEYDYELGAPLGPATAGANGAYRRAFAQGLVLVNPTGSAKQVEFGAKYSGSGVHGATQTSLPPTSGLVLTRDDGPVQDSVRGSAPAEPITVLATPMGPKAIELRWRGGARGRIKYRVRRNGRLVAIVRGLQLRDRLVRAGRRYRYRVTAVRPGAHVVGVSRVVRIRTPRKRRRGAARAASGGRLNVALAASSPSDWSRVYVEMRTRRRGRVRWRQLTRQTRPRAAMRFRVHLRRRAVVRVVLVSSTGSKLRSGIVRTGG